MNEDDIGQVNVYDFDKMVDMMWGISDDDEDDDDDNDSNKEESNSDSESSDSESSISSGEGDSKPAGVSDGDESGGDMEIDQEQNAPPDDQREQNGDRSRTDCPKEECNGQ
jgi:hypothetical protein